MSDAHERAEGMIERLNAAFAVIAGWSFDHRWIVSGVCLALFGVSFWLAGQVGIDSSYEAYFDEDDTTFQAYEAYREDFGSDEVAYIGYEVPGLEHGPWNLEAMRKLAQLTRALEDEVPFIYEATSLANAELIQGVPDGIEISKIWDDMPETQEELLALSEAYMTDSMYVDGIISRDGDFGAIIIEMDRSSTDPPEEIIWDPEKGGDLENLYPQVTEARIAEILARPEYADFVFYSSGDVPLNAIFNRVITVEPYLHLAIAMALISATLLFFFRSIVAVVTPITVMLLTVTMTVALITLLGWEIGLTFGSTPTILMAIGIAHSVHILSEFRAKFIALGDRREALVGTMYLVGTPCLLTSLTTAAGFASMSFVPIKSIAHSAVYNAFGVLAAFFLSFTLLMSLLSFGRRTPSPRTVAAAARSGAKGGERMGAILGRIADFNIRHQKALLVLFGVFLVFCAANATRIEADSNWLEDFWDDSPIRIDTMRVDGEMGGTTNIIYLFDGGEEDAIKNPAVLGEIERLQNLADQEEWLVRKTYSLVDIVKDLNKAFHGGDPAWARIPESRELTAQLLLLYEMSGGEEAEEYVSSDYRHANLELRLRLGRTGMTQDLVEKLRSSLEEDPLEHSELSLTGIGALWLKLMDYILVSQVQGFTIAFSVITLMMIAIFRSVKIGLISMVPNLAPVLLALGAMGALDILLDYNKLMIAAIAIGISVDDTIHLMTRFHHEFMRHRSYEVALRAAIGDVGRALMITSLALVLGFMVFLTSALRAQATYGTLLTSAIVVALIADFFFMPALVLWLKPFGPEGEARGSGATAELAEAA